MKKSHFLYFILVSFTAFAQQYYPASGNLNIFSDNPERFYVYLNGELQNSESKTNVRIENLNQRYYNVRIVFENKSLKDIINKHVSVIANDGATFEESTYKIKVDKNKKMKLIYFSSAPIFPNYVPASDVFVIHEQPSNPNIIINNGINININNSKPESRDNHKKSIEKRCPELNSKDFEIAITTIKKESFDDQKLSIAQNIILNNCLRTDQIAQIAKTLSFSQNQMKFVKSAYTSCTDPKNYYLIKDIFSFAVDQQYFMNFINSKN
ncbi:DUF4476 domain-containing protein [Flavobacterium sp. MDT1-60]|uniref:DUF4476 domain-containing protein n=1 Tax=Flavobacterium sp. MDT1-60 TaxID=1979344 RepID=UPI00177B3635|nr:DUF4476 domain-containing protein [Flavobacterium sp. MDT1-60]QOG02457.1 DUF4476 domain-containing protein [Flavobacterium sp. MDT1-60]